MLLLLLQKKETQRWSAVIPGKISEGEKQPYKASIDLCLVDELFSPPRTNARREIKKTSAHNGTPHLTSSI